MGSQKLKREFEEKGEEKGEEVEEARINEKHLKNIDLNAKNEEKKEILGILERNNYELNYGLEFRSAYCDGEYDGKKICENPIFTGTMGKMRCLDYIFYEKNKGVEVVGLLEIPSDREKTGRKPQWHYPSDHFSIMAKFKFER